MTGSVVSFVLLFCMSDSALELDRIPAFVLVLRHLQFVQLDDMKNDYIYITDYDLPRELEALYKENGIKIYMGEK